MSSSFPLRMLLILFIFTSLLSNAPMAQSALQPYVMVLGTTQDGGYPHIGCERECCKKVYDNKIKPGKTTALALVDPASKKWWLGR